MGRKVFALVSALLFLYVASPLIFPVMMGGVISVLFLPLLRRLERRKIPASLGAGILTFGITLLLLLPTALLTFLGAKNGFQQLQKWKDAPNTAGVNLVDTVIGLPRVHGLLEWMTAHFPVKMDDLLDTAKDVTSGIGLKLADLFGQFVAHLPGMVLALVVIIVSIYFFLVDGRQLVAFVRKKSFFNPMETEQLLKTLGGTCRSVILASVVSGGAQAGIETLVCLFAGIPNAALIGLLVFLASFIPVVGSAPITLGLALQQFLSDQSGTAIVLLISAIVVATIDNLIRPWFLRGSANLHPLLAFVAAIGGLQTLGFLGVFLGPIAATMFLVTLHIITHREEYSDNLSD